MGSPPPMRGKVSGELLDINQYGITPAYAGKSTIFQIKTDIHRDHPRLCGEKLLQKHSVMWRAGSPPPMRGKVARKMPEWYEERITPAYAGKSPACDFCGRDTWDHPRLCGEKPVNFPASASGGGSPPPMRGKGITEHSKLFAYRITPAYAGKSFSNPRHCHLR